jgi:hypothetical protein
MDVMDSKRADVLLRISKDKLDHKGIKPAGLLKTPRPRIPKTGPRKTKPPKTHFKKDPKAPMQKKKKKGGGDKGKKVNSGRK